MDTGGVDNVFVTLAELWPYTEVGILLESVNAVTDYSVWDFTAISIWVKTDFVLKIKAFKNRENNYLFSWQEI